MSVCFCSCEQTRPSSEGVIGYNDSGLPNNRESMDKLRRATLDRVKTRINVIISAGPRSCHLRGNILVPEELWSKDKSGARYLDTAGKLQGVGRIDNRMLVQCREGERWK
jgi:hypothetical protein